LVSEEPKEERTTTTTAKQILCGFKVIQDKLDKENVDNYTSQFDRMVHSPEWSLKVGLDTEPNCFHSQIQSHNRIKKGRLSKKEISENDDWTNT
jgi:hypothetical protein